MAASSKFAVAAHLMTALAFNKQHAMPGAGDSGYSTSSYLAKSVNTNPVVVRRILAKLIKAGLVVSLPGKKGGTALAKPADQISLLDIYLAVGEESVFGLNLNEPFPHCPISRNMGKLLFPVLSEAGLAVKGVLQKRRLSELAAQIPR